ncbi:MAG: hypothetical protein NTX52_04510 [Planctomycetota bacterium]|nr:hypothetical protein [Planctomycetota bacterium]
MLSVLFFGKYRKINKYLQCTLVMVLLVFMTQAVRGKMMPPDRAKQLQGKGYATDTPEQIIEATKSESYFTRHIALELLTQQTGKKAIPTLKEALNDPRVEVRWRAAHWLETLGDNSGLERMRQDFKELAPNNVASIPPDPNVTDPNEIKERENKRNLRLYNALTVAKVLAELGDRQGYELAARMVLEGPWKWQRYEAIYTLIEIAKTDQATLQAEGLDPVFVLSAMAESEKDEHVIYLLANQVQENLSKDIAIRILEVAKKSPNLSEKNRRVVQMHLDTVKAK